MARKTGWADEELAGIDLGDERRNERARRLLTRFAEKPTQSIVGASHGWSETMAAYRFVGNDAFEWHDIMQPHWERTHERMSRESIVLCLDDTTELDFNGQAIEGLGPLNYETRRGMYLHPTYAVSPERVPLGVLNAWMWSRKPKTEDGERHDIKESTRWIEGYERVAEMAAELPTTRLVYVADREADILALMRRADELDTPADWLIRAKHNRSLEGGEKLWRKVEQTEAVGELKFQMASRPGQRARTVKQEIRVRRVALPAKTGVLEVTCIVATEVDPPAGMKPVQWRLLTNREATGLDELGNRDVLQRAEEWLQGRGDAVVDGGPVGAGAGAVHDCGVAHCVPDAARPNVSRPRRNVVLRSGRDSRRLFADEEATTATTAEVERSGSVGCAVRRLSSP